MKFSQKFTEMLFDFISFIFVFSSIFSDFCVFCTLFDMEEQSQKPIFGFAGKFPWMNNVCSKCCKFNLPLTNGGIFWWWWKWNEVGGMKYILEYENYVFIELKYCSDEKVLLNI